MSEAENSPPGGSAAVPIRLCSLTAMSPLHVGADGGFGLIDKPVMRERATGYPLLPGSALKGVLRGCFAAEDEDDEDEAGGAPTPFQTAFGRRAHQGQDNAGSLIFTDAQLFALPVRSYYGTTAWVSTPYLLERHAAQLARFAQVDLPEPPALGLREIALPDDSVLKRGSQVVLEEFDLAVQAQTPALHTWADWLARHFWSTPDALSQRAAFLQRFALVSDVVFEHLCRYGLELRARVKIDPDSRTVETGHLWYEELLPEGSLLLAYVFCEKVFRRGKEAPLPPQQLLASYCSGQRYLQFGGTASVGRGLCRVAFHDPQVAAAPK